MPRQRLMDIGRIANAYTFAQLCNASFDLRRAAVYRVEQLVEDAVTADTILTHELESLHKKLAGSHRKRRSQPTDHPSAKRAERPEKAVEEHGLHKEIQEFVKLVANYVEEAKGDISAHPSISVLGAMVVGILIGRLLGRH